MNPSESSSLTQPPLCKAIPVGRTDTNLTESRYDSSSVQQVPAQLVSVYEVFNENENRKNDYDQFKETERHRGDHRGNMIVPST